MICVKNKSLPMILAPYPDYVVVSPHGYQTRKEAEQVMEAYKKSSPRRCFALAQNNKHPDGDKLWYVLQRID
ncbi:MAG: hypothetical protein J6J36_08395 [Clostridia bacterium]|nr:hypothetical protein [Clostridia bacterium]